MDPGVKVPDPFTSSRLDQILRDGHPELSWRQIRDAIAKGQVTVDGRVERDPGCAVEPAMAVVLNRNRPATRHVRAPFEILHEDHDILVVNKPAGVLTIPSSPAAGSSEDTILKRAREYVELRRGHKGYVGMLHRLDRETSGALAMALSKDAHARGRELFKHHRFERHYLALVRGVPEPRRGTIEARISSHYADGRRKLVGPAARGLDATTDYAVREAMNDAALLELTLHTGRQHQIRLHLEKLGHPLVGERVYTGARGAMGARGARGAMGAIGAMGARGAKGAGAMGAARPMLHAWTLAFPHPITGERIAVEAPLPEDFERQRRALGRSR